MAADVAPKKITLHIDLPSTLDAELLNYSEIGDQYAEGIFSPQTGTYAKLSKLYQQGAELCTKTLKNKKIDVQSVKKELKDAKKKCLSQSQYCIERKDEFSKQYQIAKQLYEVLERNR